MKYNHTRATRHCREKKFFGIALLSAAMLSASGPAIASVTPSNSTYSVDQQKKVKVTGVVTDKNREPDTAIFLCMLQGSEHNRDGFQNP